MTQLTPKEHRFVTEYLFDLNGTQAAIRAGYRKSSARSMASELLARPYIADAVEAGKLAREERVNFSADEVLSELANAVRADILDLYDDNGVLLPVDEWPLEFRKGLIAEVETQEEYEEDKDTGERIHTGRAVKVKLVDRSKFIALAGKHVSVKAFQDTIEVKGLGELSDRMDRAEARLREREAARAAATAAAEQTASVAPSEDISDD